METNHNILVRHLFINKALWKDIGETNQKVMLDAWKEASLMIEKMYLEKDGEYKQKLKDKGMVIVKPDVEAFRKATENVWKDFAPQAWGAGVYEEIQSLR